MPAQKRLRIPAAVLERAAAQAAQSAQSAQVSKAPRPPPPPKAEPVRRLPRDKIVQALRKLHPMD